MDANQQQYVICHQGSFVLPDEVYRWLEPMVTNGFVYLRQDHDALTISSTRLTDGYRRVFQPRFRSPMFRAARQLAIVNLQDSLLIMPVS
jgi:hypothetical protein